MSSLALSLAELCDPKSKAFARHLLAATSVGAVTVLADELTIVVGSNADTGVCSSVDDEGVPLAASLDVGNLGCVVEDENSWWWWRRRLWNPN